MAIRFKTEPESFPSLYLDGREWERLPDRLADPFFAALHEANLGRLSYMHADSSARDIREAACSGKTNDIPRRLLKDYFQRSVVAWFLTREESHLEMARLALTAACRSASWRLQAGEIDGLRAADLATGELLHLVASGFDMLHAYLDDETRDLCIDALLTKGLPAYLDGLAMEDWWCRCDFNWNSALHGNAGVAALVVRHRDRELSDRVLREAIAGLPYLIESFYPDGGYIEGLMYLCTAVGHLTDFIVPYHKFTGDDLGLLTNRDFHDTITFLVEMHGGDGRVYNFSDVQEGRTGMALPHLLWWARMLDRADWTADQKPKLLSRGAQGDQSAKYHGLFRAVESFWYAEPHQSARPHVPRPLRHFAGIDWLRWRGRRSWLAFRAGFNGGNHDNDDLGTFILGIDDERFLTDPGYGATKASQHNCVTIRRHEQTDGAVAPIVRADETPDGFYVDCDLQAAFPHALAHYHRHLLLIDDLHLLLLDDIKGRGCMRADVRGHFQTRLPARIVDKGFAIDGQKNTLRIHYLGNVDGLHVRSWDHGGQTFSTLQWDDTPYRIHSIQPVLLTFGCPVVEYELTPGRFEVSVDGHHFSFEERDGVLTLQDRTCLTGTCVVPGSGSSSGKRLG